jgi:FlaA1/EpsC-like NDP-sugar epimerase
MVGKLYEELITVGENILPTGHEKIMVLRSNYQPGEGNILQESQKILGNKVDKLMEDALRHDSSAIKKILKEIVPEYTPQENEAVL